MKGLLSSRRRLAAAVVCASIAISAVAVACAPDASKFILSPGLGAQLEAQAAGEEVVAVAAVAAPKLAELTPEEIYAGLPPELADLVPSGSVENGTTASMTYGCIGCHSLDPAVKLAGPTWYNVGDHAVSRIEGTSPAEYLHQSIVNSGAFIVPDYPAGIMPATFGEQLSDQEVADIIAYLLTLSGQPE